MRGTRNKRVWVGAVVRRLLLLAPMLPAAEPATLAPSSPELFLEGWGRGVPVACSSVITQREDTRRKLPPLQGAPPPPPELQIKHDAHAAGFAAHRPAPLPLSTL